MSKQSDAKKSQGFRKTPDTCANCVHFTMDVVEVKVSWERAIFTEEKNKRCGKGGFAVGKNNTCDQHKRTDA